MFYYPNSFTKVKSANQF